MVNLYYHPNNAQDSHEDDSEDDEDDVESILLEHTHQVILSFTIYNMQFIICWYL